MAVLPRFIDQASLDGFHMKVDECCPVSRQPRCSSAFRWYFVINGGDEFLEANFIKSRRVSDGKSRKIGLAWI